eukprot:TRINITY_DN1553_c0_g1_i6.p1 TRINITY_DN1553_c0_g1~~TRINITY_DN1553_c0_g1_i6.p1  ORF type:complete len:574 (-),score=262.87 TRINITY_DN1553_c0_g1_i6:50-1693(-)
MSLDSLQAENQRLKNEIAFLKKSNEILIEHELIADLQDWDIKEVLSIIVIGASGDLAKKKTFPALFALFRLGFIPHNVIICGYARTKMTTLEFHSFLRSCLKKDEKLEEFILRCEYVSGQYEGTQGFTDLSIRLKQLETESALSIGQHINTSNSPALGSSPNTFASRVINNRVFYFAIPPSIFIPVACAINNCARSQNGWTRVVVEKPFGRDLESAQQLSRQLATSFREEELFRIDHYLGKEMVQNLMVFRFSNSIFEPLWNRHHVKCVLITFKEDIGTDGRGGYFDNYGIIRDVMQNHILQIMALVAMEPPISSAARDVRDEKVKLLRSVAQLKLEDVVVGQYGPSKDQTKKGYLDDPTVPRGSITPTFATAVLHVNNARWAGTPFILKCGKALNERKAEVRIQFHAPATQLFTNQPQNELVIRVQPNEAIYWKFVSKKPGLSCDLEQTELDLTYHSRFEIKGGLPDAYERLILDVTRGDHNLFVRDDELEVAWQIFTPLLKQLEQKRIQPIIYEFGGRGPSESDLLLQKYNYSRNLDYSWRGDKK